MDRRSRVDSSLSSAIGSHSSISRRSVMSRQKPGSSSRSSKSMRWPFCSFAQGHPTSKLAWRRSLPLFCFPVDVVQSRVADARTASPTVASPRSVARANSASLIWYSSLIPRISDGVRTPRCRHTALWRMSSASSSRYVKSQERQERKGIRTEMVIADSPDPQTRVSSTQLVETVVAPHWAQDKSRPWDWWSPVVIFQLLWFGVVEASANDLARPKLELDVHWRHAGATRIFMTYPVAPGAGPGRVGVSACRGPGVARKWRVIG